MLAKEATRKIVKMKMIKKKVKVKMRIKTKAKEMKMPKRQGRSRIFWMVMMTQRRIALVQR